MTITSDLSDYYLIEEDNCAVNSLLFSSNAPGIDTITAKSDLYDQNSLIVEVV